MLRIYKKYKYKISFTFFIVLLESILMLLFPLIIGYAINGMIEQSYIGIYKLVVLGVLVTVIGTIRRFYDTRIYANIYKELSVELSQDKQEHSVSEVSGKITMLKEMVDFFENSFPMLIDSVIGLIGTLIILFTLSMSIFFACFVVAVIIFIVFALSSKKTLFYNRSYNRSIEKQVDVISSKDPVELDFFLKKMTRWSVKLSDIESINFFIIWLGMIALIVFSIISASSASLAFGSIFSIIMYVFDFADKSTMLPIYYQQYLRLKEISKRL